MEFPDDLRYTREHEWVRVEDGRARVGITDYAQDALGDVVYVQLPDTGTNAIAHSSVCEVESPKSVSEVFAPLTGTVVEVNDALAQTPELVNQDPFGDGWLFALEVADASELDGLLDAGAYRSFVEEQ
jgi:glycine cleavage system H protein